MRRLLLLIGLLAASCNDRDPEPNVLVLEAISPRVSEGLFLNESIRLTFDRPVDPSSLTSHSLRIEAEDGTSARGRWRVSDRVITFTPEAILRSDLRGGGYRPGTHYVVQGAGFPWLDGLRGMDGAPLAASFRWEFSTVALDGGQLFDDASPERAYPVRFDRAQWRSTQGVELRSGEPLRLLCDEPVDPSTLRNDEFLISVRGSDAEPVALLPVLVRNEAQGAFQGEDASVIELWPREPLLPSTHYELRFRQPFSLTDFQGNPVPVPLGAVTVIPRKGGGAERRRPTLAFMDVDERTPLPVPGTDGVAHWDRGRVQVRYPAAAGSGEAGRIEHGHPMAETDVHGIRVHVPGGEELSLAPGRGMRVLRSQGSLRLEGTFKRSIDDDIARRGPAEGEDPFLEGETLSEWLARAQGEDWDWTVIIAGGDLVVPGSIDCDTPLLLVSGGWIRVSGRIRHTPRQLWLLGDGGGGEDLTASAAELTLDAPKQNQLKEPYSVGVVSSAVPSQVRAYRWLSLDMAGDPGSGRYTVRFLPPSGPIDLGQAVPHPRLLDPGPVRVVVQLFVPSADEQRGIRGDATWNPPLVDYVDLDWEDSE